MSSATAALPLAFALPEELARRLEEEIIFGGLAPGQRLIEEEVAVRYGVSRSPVREALRRLESDGLVLREARKGIWVMPLSLEQFDEVYACRVVLEGLAAEAAAKSPDRTLKAGFTPLRTEMRRASKAGDVRAFFVADVRGSDLIYRLAGNNVLTRLLTSLKKEALRFRYVLYSRDGRMVKRSLKDSLQIFDAIEAGDAVAARRLTETLIRDLWSNSRDTVANEIAAG